MSFAFILTLLFGYATSLDIHHAMGIVAADAYSKCPSYCTSSRCKSEVFGEKVKLWSQGLIIQSAHSAHQN
eukprot:1161524-Pelagomonas_calceolata.AAC.2